MRNFGDGPSLLLTVSHGLFRAIYLSFLCGDIYDLDDNVGRIGQNLWSNGGSG